jgi:hypothetical protein
MEKGNIRPFATERDLDDLPLDIGRRKADGDGRGEEGRDEEEGEECGLACSRSAAVPLGSRLYKKKEGTRTAYLIRSDRQVRRGRLGESLSRRRGVWHRLGPGPDGV